MAKRKVWLDGSPRTLSDSEYVASGGEGSVWRQGQAAFKVWADPSGKAGLRPKIEALSKLRHKFLVAPIGPLLDERGALVGLAMPWVEGEALPRLFANGWRDAHGFGPKQTAALTRNMREALAALHGFGAVAVDANEFNWLAKGVEPALIDSDSWALGPWGGTAIMQSIKDPLAKGVYGEGSDWFAWAAVTFQLWTGIHPYKGRHPDFGPGQLAERMEARASVFDPKTRLPPAARPFSEIPSALLDWYEAVFSGAERKAPPEDFGGGRKARSGGAARGSAPAEKCIAGLERIPLPPGFKVAAASAAGLLFGADGRWLDPGKMALMPGRLGQVPTRTAEGGWILWSVSGGALSAEVRGASGALEGEASEDLDVRCVFTDGVRLFAVGGGGIFEAKALKAGAALRICAGPAWPIPPARVEAFDGGALIDAVGSRWVALPAEGGISVERAQALDRVHAAEAKASGRVLRVLAGTGNGLAALRLAFGPGGCEAREDGDGLESALAPSGVLAEVPQEGVLRLSKGASVREVSAPAGSGGWTLLRLPSGIGAVSGGELFKVSVG